MGNAGKSIIFWVVLLLSIVLLYDFVQGNAVGSRQVQYPFSVFMNKVDEGQVGSVIIQGNIIEGELQDGTVFSTYAPHYPELVANLRERGVMIDATPTDTVMNSFLGLFISWLPLIVIIGVWIFFMRQMQGGSGRAMGFGRSRAKLLEDKKDKVTFADVAGIDEAKEELSEIVEFLKSPAKFQRLGGKIPKGCLLVGSPGTGKTLLARAIAGEAEVPFFTISGSDFVEMFVGVGASRVRDMFEQGKKSAPCLIFIDEIDAVGRHRGIGLGGGNDEREQTLNQLLVEMDGFEDNEGVIIIAATNRPDVLDPALLRPGRFDRQITVPLPDITGREKILNVHLARVSTAPDVEPRVIARGTPGFSGAELANLANEAALIAARENKKLITMRELEAAKDKILMGVERKSMVMQDEEKKLTAFHEAGHALVGMHCKASDPIHKATIIPRGRALGLVMRLPEKDKISVTREQLKADLAVAMGGRVAEELVFGYDKVTSGASSDIQQATKIATSMVMEWGMSDKLGPLLYGDGRQDAYDVSQGVRSSSDETAQIIDSEIKGFVEEGYERAEEILKENREDLDTLAHALLEYETLSGDEIRDLLDGKPIRVSTDSDTGGDSSAVPPRSSVPHSGKKKSSVRGSTIGGTPQEI